MYKSIKKEKKMNTVILKFHTTSIPEEIMDFASFVKFCDMTAYEQSIKSKGHMPLLVCLTKDEFMFTPVIDFMENETRKEILSELMSKLLKSEDVLAICLVCEAWMSIVKNAEIPKTTPSQDPDKIDTLMLMATSFEGKHCQINYRKRFEGEDLILENRMESWSGVDGFHASGKFVPEVRDENSTVH